jgi:hypothetical protein
METAILRDALRMHGYSTVMRILPMIVAILAVVQAVAADQDSYIPVRTGTEWVMDAKAESGKGGTLTGTGHRWIEGEVEKDGVKYVRERTNLEFGSIKNEYAQLIRKDASGFYGIPENGKDAVEQKQIAFPLKVGTSWEFTYNGRKHAVTVIALESIKIGDKRYEECFHLRSVTEGGGLTEDFWEAPNMGSIKSEMLYPDGTKITLTLKKFKPGR